MVPFSIALAILMVVAVVYIAIFVTVPANAFTDMGPSSCKKSILEWQKDSTWYANKVSNILKNIKETK